MSGIVLSKHVWLDMLASCNDTSHVYDNKQTVQVVTGITIAISAPLPP